MELYALLDGVRLSRGDEATEAVLVFTQTLNWQTEPDGKGGLQLLLFPVELASVKRQTTTLTAAGFVVRVESLGRFSCKMTIEAPDRRKPVLPAAGGDGRGRSLVLAFRDARPLDEQEPRPFGRLETRGATVMHPGLTWRRMSWTSSSGQHSTVNVLEVDLVHGDVKLALSTGEPVMNMRTLLSEMARRNRALAALNASYFSMSNGDPLGLLLDRGKVISSPIYGRSAFGVCQDRRFVFGNPEFSGRIRTRQGTVAMAALNEKRRDGRIVVYTPEFGESTGTEANGLEIAVSENRVVAVGAGDLQIPRDGIVLSVHGGTQPVLQALAIGDAISYEYGVTPPWSLCSLAIGGGPRLVKDGKPAVNAEEERFDHRFTYEHAPRTAVGTAPDGTLYLVALDGRHPPRDTGATLPEMASVMIALGCNQALNLDGGGSTTMVVRDRIVNRPSDGRERGISTGIMVLPRTRQLAAGPSVDR
jgi:uncharacterized protein YigE (DUF2233 family)